MEIEGNDGSKTHLKPGSTTQFGRGNGFNSTNPTVSRRHLTFQMSRHHQEDEPTVHFEVTSKNPIWVHTQKTGQVEIYRSFDKGEMKIGDMFCVSAENPIWFTLKKVEEEGDDNVKKKLGFEDELAESLENTHGAKGVEEFDTESVDLSSIDPIKEFGFVVMGHEFDIYAKKIIRDARKWQWFVDEPEEESTDDEDDGEEKKKGKKRVRRKKKKGEEKDDEDWTGESEDEKDLVITKSRKIQKPVYSTRSKDPNRGEGEVSSQKKSTQVDEEEDEDEEDEDDDEDETLGGFIVDDVADDVDEMDEDDDDDEEDLIGDDDEEEE